MSVVRGTLAVLSITLGLAVPARAEPIVLTSGVFNWASGAGAAAVTLSGGGFSFTGSAAQFSGIFTPWSQCFVPECTGGTTVNLFSRFTGGDIPGTATYNGVTYPSVGSASGQASLDARWSGSLLLPTSFAGGVLTAPVQFSGLFFYQPTPTTGEFIDLVGSGRATLTFAPSRAFPGMFNVTGVRYEIEAAPVPEPASMLLIGSGLVGLAALRRRRGRGAVNES